MKGHVKNKKKHLQKQLQLHVNEQDSIRKRYILKGTCHLYAYDYPSRKIYGKDGRFSFVWFHKYHSIEYSRENEAAYCFYCYLFGKKKWKIYYAWLA